MPAPDAAAPDAPTDPTVDADLDEVDDEDEDEEIEIPDLRGFAHSIQGPTVLIYGEYDDELLFVPRVFADAVNDAVPDIDAAEADWFDVVPWIAQIQERWLPESVVTEFGTRSDSALDGSALYLDPDDLDAILARLAEAGYTCLPDHRMVRFLCEGT